ncbi:hypothetical protein EVB91_152 [Rhizobium phage RHph_I1_18]|nr:hypothetical protein EVB91_152 [Rhizobium phage RHph_I1_18]
MEPDKTNARPTVSHEERARIRKQRLITTIDDAIMQVSLEDSISMQFHHRILEELMIIRKLIS